MARRATTTGRRDAHAIRRCTAPLARYNLPTTPLPLSDRSPSPNASLRVATRVSDACVGVRREAPLRRALAEALGAQGDTWLAIEQRIAAHSALDDDGRALVRSIVAAAKSTANTLERMASSSRRAHEERSLAMDHRARDEALVAESPAMKQLLHETIDRVAPFDVTVLLLGESGVGKELLARRLHGRSPRARRPMLAVNCGALPESLIESALFGHERGAFTGAERRHEGVIERAHGSTLFLDEVGELTAAAQVRLLRVLATSEFERVGGAETLSADVRVVAATHRSLEALVREGRFREDLYYRLRVVEARVAPLRERVEDIVPIAESLLQRASARHALATPTLTHSQRSALERAPWPGNVRQLANVIERSLILSANRAFELSLDPDEPERHEDRGPSAATLSDATRDAIERALEASHGRVHGADGAAARLGLPPSTLKSMLRRLGIDRGRFARTQ
ncbi:MAG: sigma-54-dependent Fis family transcriptional regulator [Myxococcales bacterium]|nr:sigma-54-dependent Fis family transcriptional regulator [Myxococcales bacterium]